MSQKKQIKLFRAWRVIRANVLYEWIRFRRLAKARFVWEFGDPGHSGRRTSALPHACPHCGWVGLERELIHTYAPVEDCVEPIDKCPNCESWEPPRLRTWRNRYEANVEKFEAFLDPGYQQRKKRLTNRKR